MYTSGKETGVWVLFRGLTNLAVSRVIGEHRVSIDGLASSVELANAIACIWDYMYASHWSQCGMYSCLVLTSKQRYRSLI